ncbi:hypothetical protein E6W36_06980 [Hankyongella ginsenosidimutans]|uniref:Uncharacterized protein n=1 Tax=Hankyongella ginsenosidimutans TaxID=1763828 RepID=A0A4D7CBY7_9SPHN|nr:hypothetical protein [Hankyongella ginsenosidimutans]QCI79382.1 hypothetical protein E6W36_06980 [Hankyongella ginsenosidimutans]
MNPARGAATVGGLTLASRVLGFARDMWLARLIGAGPVADALFLALRVPELMRRLVAEGRCRLPLHPRFRLHGSRVATPRPHARSVRLWALCCRWRWRSAG